MPHVRRGHATRSVACLEPIDAMVPDELVLLLRLGRVAATGQGRCREHANPLRPVAAQFKEIVVEHQVEVLKLLKEVLKRLGVVDWADDDEISLDAELVRGQAELRIEGGANETDAFVRGPADDKRRRAWLDGERHRPQDRRGR